MQDCRICQAKLAAATADLSDERTKYSAATAQRDAVTAERDAAVRAARGTLWKRTRTAAKWLLIGAAAGALISHAH